MIQEHDCIVLTQDIPDEGLQAGLGGRRVSPSVGLISGQVDEPEPQGQPGHLSKPEPASLSLIQPALEEIDQAPRALLTHPRGGMRPGIHAHQPVAGMSPVLLPHPVDLLLRPTNIVLRVPP